jgi:hypothetical protein
MTHWVCIQWHVEQVSAPYRVFRRHFRISFVISQIMSFISCQIMSFMAFMSPFMPSFMIIAHQRCLKKTFSIKSGGRGVLWDGQKVLSRPLADSLHDGVICIHWIVTMSLWSNFVKSSPGCVLCNKGSIFVSILTICAESGTKWDRMVTVKHELRMRVPGGTQI